MTPRQQQLLGFIRSYMQEHDGVCPSYEEMAVGIGLKWTSKSTIKAMVDALERDGHIIRTPAASRSIIIVDDPVKQAVAHLTRYIRELECENRRLRHANPN